MENFLAQALGQDITQMAVAEKQMLLSRLLARLAHEIRNPLSSLDIHFRLLEEDLTRLVPHLREQMGNRFDIIQGELHRLDAVVKSFLRLAGPSALDPQPVEVAKIVHHVCDLLRPEAAERSITLSAKLPASIDPLEADPVQLTQALINLVINAIQAVNRNGRIELAVEDRKEEGYLCIAVQDTGPGVPQEAAATIFEPFFTTKEEGSGLGLWIAQQIALAHEGDIQVKSAPGGGAVFTLRIQRSLKKSGRA